MEKPKDLKTLNKEGDLGKLLAEKFHGELGRLYEIKDSEFLVKFATQREAPTAQMVKEAIRAHYQKLGFIVTIEDGESNPFETFIKDPKNNCLIGIVVSTEYPIKVGEEPRHIRVTTAVI